MYLSKLNKKDVFFKMENIKKEEFYLISAYNEVTEKVVKVYGMTGEEVQELLLDAEDSELLIDCLRQYNPDVYLVVFDIFKDDETFYSFTNGDIDHFFGIINGYNELIDKEKVM